MKDQIKNYIKAGYSGLFIVSHEEQRIEAMFKGVVAAMNKDAGKKEQWGLHAWSVTDGIIANINGDSPEAMKDTTAAFAALCDFVEKLPERSILLMRDFHLMLIERDPILYRKVKDVLSVGKTTNRVLVILGCRLTLPQELEKEMTVIDFALPDREQLRSILETVVDEQGIKIGDKTDKVLDAAGGLTTIEAENAFALSIIEADGIDPDIVAREKSNTVKKNGLLEIIPPNVTLADIGGLEHLKADLELKRNLFTKQARDYGLPTPRGQLYVGQPGTGKSLCATAAGGIFDIPLLRLEAGRIFGSLVGESESNWRKAWGTAKAVAPCVLWIDEIDGLTAGAESSGKTDGGTTARVIKAVLQDLQFNCDGIFPVFTANDIDGLPDPLIDRLDVWSVELPNRSEREAIFAIHIAKRKRKPEKFDLAELADCTDGFSGRQIEQLWIKAMTVAFNAKREPNEKDITTVAKSFVATSVLMKDAIDRRRKRLEGRATPASAPEKTADKGSRKLAR